MQNDKSMLKKVIPIFVLIFVIIVGVWIYSILRFRVISTTPANNSDIPSSTPVIEVAFNKDIEAKDIQQKITTNKEIINGIDVNKNIIKIQVAVDKIVIDESFEIILKNITSVNGDILEYYKLEYRSVFVPYEKLSESEKLKLVEDNGRNEETLDPVLSILPYSTIYYSIEALTVGNEKPKITIRPILLGSEAFGSEADSVYEQRKNDALKYLTNNGFNLDNYEIIYE